MQLLRSRKEEKKNSFPARKAAEKAAGGTLLSAGPQHPARQARCWLWSPAAASPAHLGWSCCRSQREQGRGFDSHDAMGMDHGTPRAP